MSVPTIQINSTPTQISTHLTLGQSSIHTQYPSVEIHSSNPQANIQTNPAILEIDWTQTRAEIGLMTQSIFMRHWRDDAKSYGMRMIGQYAQEGDTLQRIENDGNPIADIAKSKSQDEVSFNIDAIPKTPPAITYMPADIDARPSTPNPEIKFRPGEAYIDIYDSNVDTRVTQLGSVDISVTGKVFDFLA